MKFKNVGIILPIILLPAFSSSGQQPAGQEIAINESQLSYLAPESCEFSEKYEFDMRFNTFKEVNYNTYLFRTPGLDMKELVRPVHRGSIVKAYKHFKADNVWAVKYENDWGFISADLLTKLDSYEEPLDVDDLDVPPQLLSKLSIKYPTRARREGIKGEVVLRILVSNTGAVSRIEVEKSIPLLDSAAIIAVEKLRFKPAKKYGMPTDVWVRVPLNFELVESQEQ
jgi:TonB family protein